MTLGFSSLLPSSKSEKTNGHPETVTFNSTAGMCDPLKKNPDLAVPSKPSPYRRRNTLAMAIKDTSVPIPAAKGRQEFFVFLSFTCFLIIKALENLNLPVQGQASNSLMVECLA